MKKVFSIIRLLTHQTSRRASKILSSANIRLHSSLHFLNTHKTVSTKNRLLVSDPLQPSLPSQKRIRVSQFLKEIGL